ncbi:MAG: hypothetical protein Q7R45_07175 [Sulfuricaulis sp.]|nr:hypothetical protein [Sulfuricaulis sp.]
MHGSFTARRRRSTEIKDQSVLISKFGKCVVALKPTKPALWLAQKIGCSERHANRLISGTRKVNAHALVVVMDEID